MGQFRPAWSVRARVPTTFVWFNTGFVTSAVLSFWLAFRIGAVAGTHERSGVHLLLLVVGAAVLVGGDAMALRRRRACSVGPRRQTPRAFGFMRAGTLLWGLDTGTPFSTVRLTTLPLLGLLFSTLGYGSPWNGFAYAAGFLGALVWTSRRTVVVNVAEEPDAIAVLRLLSRRTPAARRAGFVVAVSASALMTAQVVA